MLGEMRENTSQIMLTLEYPVNIHKTRMMILIDTGKKTSKFHVASEFDDLQSNVPRRMQTESSMTVQIKFRSDNSPGYRPWVVKAR